METIWNAGVDFILFLQNLGSWLVPPMQLFSFLGTSMFAMVFLPFFYWNIDTVLGLRLAVMLMVSSATVDAFKLAFHQPRPYWYDTAVKAFGSEISFGFPSAHAFTAAAMWGYLAAILKRRWVWILSLGLVFFIGLSRLVLGLHFPTDVLVGWALGFVLVALFVNFAQPFSRWWNRQSYVGQVLVGFAGSIVFLGCSVVFFLYLAGWSIPAAWTDNALAAGAAAPVPVNLEGPLTSTGTLFGLAAGYAWMKRRGGFSAQSGTPLQKIIRFVLGIIVVFIIWYGLGAIFPDTFTLDAYVLRFLRYALTGFWVAGAPAVFIRLGLGKAAS